ncbi:methyl-accepting chemotaxis protein [Anoxynatronum buryatiense]|uniref:Methyl-accepting chemotaxis sensory transducer with Cache sensor n=1 Tax=Anoxynatronum buryatiense TaxID=489973 RepID=A0AA46AHI4_9CLOT|nr:methyl-accepting chemotaxis protein [Anoxynatronum buryatiense]SMP40126.1 methyl-accepting chemotaxis sensory transducer with Cache sensor [Anoxynatronum buryatiense]
MSLARKIALIVGCLILAFVLCLGMVSLYLSTNTVMEQFEQALLSEVTSESQVIASELRSDLAVLQEIANRARTRTMNWEEQQSSLRPDVERLGFLDMAVVTPNGVASYVLGDNTAELGDRTYVKRAFEGEQNISDVIISRVTDSAVLMLAVPIEVNGRVAGVLIGRKDGNALSELTNQMGYGNEGYAYVVNRQGVVMSHPNRDFVMDQFSPNEAVKENPIYQPLADFSDFILAEESGIGSYRFNQVDSSAAFTPIPGTDWILVNTANQLEALAGLNALRYTIFIATLLFAFIGFVIAFITGRSIAQPVIRLAAVLDRFAGYDLSIHTDDNLEKYAKRKDEIGTISRSLEAMQQNLLSLIKSITESAQSVAASSEELTATSQQTTTASHEVARTIEEIANGAAEQASDTEKGAVRVNELAIIIEEDLKHIASLNQSAGTMQQLKNEGMQALKEVVSQTDETSRSADNVSQVIQRTHEQANQIQSASSMIKSIAEQTNLLALNAAIESARAGEAGRGFAVVADEIRKLAEQSNQFAGEIDTVISELTGQTEHAVTTMKRVGEIIEKQALRMNDTNDRFDGIDQSIQEVQTAIADLNRSGEQMARKKDEIIGVIENLSAIAEENAAGTEEASASVEEQTAAMAEIAESSDTLSQLAEEMQEQIARFKF